jgi:DNA (cytosine-5)-methyltransferase 1
VRKQIGMAVPVQGAKIIFEAILRSFAGIKYKTISPNLTPMIYNQTELQLEW